MLNSPLYDERAMLSQIADGDENAFRTLFHQYNQQLRPFVRKLTGSDQAVDEILQEVFLKIWLYRKKLAAVENPKAYIIRVVSNESYNYLNRLAKENRLDQKRRSPPQEAYPSPEQFFVRRETEQLIDEAVNRLPAACQQIFRMSREQELRIPEIASSLQLSNNTVKNQLVKALKIIRLHLARTAPLLLFCLFKKF